MLDLIELIIAT